MRPSFCSRARMSAPALHVVEPAEVSRVVPSDADAMLIKVWGSGAAMPQKAIVERGCKGKIDQTNAAATSTAMAG